VQEHVDKHITSDGDVSELRDSVNIFDEEEGQAELEEGKNRLDYDLNLALHWVVSP
jgi:hypothetical protein